MHNQQLRDIVHGRIYPTVHRPVTIEELLLSSPAQTPLIEKGLISRQEFVQKISEERRRIESY